MKIAIDSRSLEESKTGVGRYLSNLLRCWKKNKEHQFILYFKDKLPQNSSLFESENLTLRLLKNPLGFSSNFFFQHFLLPYHLQKDKADFFFSPFYLKPFFCPVKSSITLHDVSYEAYPEWFDFLNRLILGKLSKFSAKTADRIFTVSNYSRDEIIKYYKIDRAKISVTYLAPDESFAKIEDAEKIRAVKDKYGISKFILCVGSIFNRRHIPEIIEAFKRMESKCSGYQLLIVGKNYTYPFIDIDKKIKTANERLCRKAVVRLDFVSDEELIAFYSRCEFIVYLSDYEGFGLPVIEAQSLAKPVMTSYNSSLVEVGGDSVEFIRENTVDKIYGSLEKLISDESYRNKLVKLGSENVKRFSWEKCAGETLERILEIRKLGN